MTFELPSLSLQTAYDPAVTLLGVPGTVADGGHPSLAFLDGCHRALGRLSRAQKAEALIGLRVATNGPVRVSATVVLDAQSDLRWSEALERPVGAGFRLVRVTAQGRTRAVIQIIPDGDAVVRQRVSFDLAAEEVGPAGLFVLGLEGVSAPLPGWGTPLEQSVVGLIIRDIAIEDVDGPADAMLSVGCPRKPNGALVIPRVPGFATLNPATGSGDLEVRLAARGGQPRPARIEVVDLAGQLVTHVELQMDADRTLRAVVPGDRGPLFLRVLEPGPDGWQVCSQFRVGAQEVAQS